MTITVLPASVAEMIEHREQIEPLLKRATDRSDGSYQAIDVLRQAAARQSCLWLIKSDDRIVAVAVTEMHQRPRERTLEIPWLAGDGIEEWGLAFHDAMQKHKRELMCDQIVTVCGREGFLRFWQSQGVPVKKLGTIIALD